MLQGFFPLKFIFSIIQVKYLITYIFREEISLRDKCKISLTL